MLVESVMDRIKDGISLDHMARLIVDVHQDSSRVTDSFLSAYQLALLDLIFTGDRVNRDKIISKHATMFALSVTFDMFGFC